jgi:oligopeptide/dipeptide ABC transporter ATP-binding protein
MRAADASTGQAPLLQVEDLTVHFQTDRGGVCAVDGVSFSLRAGETLGIVGESGCGKSVTALSLLGLHPARGTRIGGHIRFDGTELVGAPPSTLRRIRGGEIAMIFQEPMTALNPVFTIGSQLVEVIRRHRGLSGRAARELAADVLGRTGIAQPRERLKQYPHELSGGMRQRVLIAMALACDPKMLIADEPTTALDVTTQAQVLEQMRELQQQTGMAMLLITHDLGVVAELCERAVVMYCGQIVEAAPVVRLFDAPRHPYTAGLLASMPRIREAPIPELPVIPGTVPDLADPPSGCRFAGRCPRVQDDCRTVAPPLRTGADDTAWACHHPLEAPTPAGKS